MSLQEDRPNRNNSKINFHGLKPNNIAVLQRATMKHYITIIIVRTYIRKDLENILGQRYQIYAENEPYCHQMGHLKIKDKFLILVHFDMVR